MGHILGIEILHDSPKKAYELAGRSDDSELRWFPSVHAVEELEETVLSLPGMSNDVRRLAQLAFLELGGYGRPVSILPSGLDEDVATAAVTGLGDVTLTNAIPAGVFGRDKSEESHELRGSLKAPPVADLGDEGHGGESTDAPEAGKPLDERFIERREGEAFDLFVEIVSSADLVVEQREILSEDRTILRGKGARLEETL